MSRTMCSRFAYAFVLCTLVPLLAHCGGNDTASIELRIASDLVPFYEVGTATATLSDGLANASDVSLVRRRRLLDRRRSCALRVRRR